MPPATKYCSGCKLDRSLTDFRKSSKYSQGRHFRCKYCLRLATARWIAGHPEYGRQFRLAYKKQADLNSRRSYLLHKEKVKRRGRLWRKENPERDKVMRSAWKQKNPERVKKFQAKAYLRHRSSIESHLNDSMSASIGLSLQGNKAGRHWEILVGYTLQELKVHLESLFTEGMTWELLFRGEIHIDHVFPLSRLIFDSAEDPTFKYAWSLGNLQPLWKRDNFRKGNQVPWEFAKEKVA